jgi:tRNA/rRNA methyltransferase
VRKAAAPKPDRRKPATAEELDRLTTLLTGVLDASGYQHSEGSSAKLRRLVRRLDLGSHDAEVWLGMLRQIRWKLTSLGKPQ